MESSRLRPEDQYPDDLTSLDDQSLQIINSKLHRQSDAEYRIGIGETETEFRLDDVRLEMNTRQAAHDEQTSEG